MIHFEEYPVVTENAESSLNHRQLMDYRSEPEECLIWLQTVETFRGRTGGMSTCWARKPSVRGFWMKPLSILNRRRVFRFSVRSVPVDDGIFSGTCCEGGQRAV